MPGSCATPGGTRWPVSWPTRPPRRPSRRTCCARGAERVWGHALADLCEDALALDPSFDLIKTVAVLLDKHFLGARYPTTLPGGVPADAYEAADSERALEVAGDVRRFVDERLAALGLSPGS